jgi:hypothetical protein
MPDNMHIVDQSFDRSKLFKPEQQDEHGNLAYEALHSAAYSAIQAPLKGATQLVDKALGTSIAPHVDLVDAPKPAEFGSGAWHAQQIGGAVGMIAPFMAVNKGVGGFVKTEGAVAETMALRSQVTQAALAGGVYEGVFRPVEDNEGNFWGARFRHATVGAATFATLTATAHGLDALGKAAPEARLMGARAFDNNLFNHAVSGVVAGGTNAQLESLLAGKGFASTQDTIRGGYTFAVVGVGMKGVERAGDYLKTPSIEAVRQEALKRDLAEVPVRTESGATTDVYTKIMSQPESVLGAEQKARIMSVLNDAYEHYMGIENSLEPGAKNKGYQVVNWKHTRGEIDQVLESAKLDKTMTPQQTEDAILASIFSDSVKTPENFIRHHLDGAKRAAEILPKYIDATTPEGAARIKGIVEAAKEHQIGPPGFMGFMTQMFIRNAVKGEMGNGAKQAFGEKMPEGEQKIYDGLVAKLMKPSGEALSPEEGAFMDRIGVARWKVENAADINAIQGKIAKPFESVSTENPGIIDFSKTQHDYLKLVGLDDWYVPNKETPWYNASRKVINGDSLINYASPDGWAKIAAIRGPGTMFKDATVWDSLASAKASFDDAATVITPDVKPLAEAGLARTQAAVERVKPQVQQWIDANKQAFGYGANEKVSFWDRDAAPLKYPEDGHPLEAQDALRLDFARQIRDRMVEALRAQQGNYSDKP